MSTKRVHKISLRTLHQQSLPVSNKMMATSEAYRDVRQEARLQMLKTLRSIPLQHDWIFWFLGEADGEYAQNLKEIAAVNTVQSFWQVYHNLPSVLPMKSSVHFFKRSVKPLWEDPRNVNGGELTYRLPKSKSGAFMTEMLMMLIGESLQELIGKDDICGVSISSRFNSDLISIWNRIASNQAGIEAMKRHIAISIPSEMLPPPSHIYYKAHTQHAAFELV